MNDVKEPSPETLRKYGLSAEQWREILEAQGGVCAICEQEPRTGRLVIDHEHITRWKKLPAERRRATVRGLLCWWCNKNYVGRCITVAKARNVVAYLEQYNYRAKVVA